MNDKTIIRLSGFLSVIIYLLGTHGVQWTFLLGSLILVSIPLFYNSHSWLLLIALPMFILGVLSPYCREKARKAEVNYDKFLRKEKWRKNSK